MTLVPRFSEFNLPPHTLFNPLLQFRYSCDSCGKVYKLKRSLYRHRTLECGKEPRYQCPHCPYRGKQKVHLKTHVAIKHQGPEMLSIKHQGPDMLSIKHQGPETLSIKHQGPETLSIKHQVSEMLSIKHQGSESAFDLRRKNQAHLNGRKDMMERLP
ncbi:hypothetical protein M8J76_015619 [Diaphorina citri]|nr:hypothetical protein M8J75_010775 [Diaphorina citri]KAI5719834.1 hypothetical protein M8J76_015619 [Diaphorina citri]KAI5721528.1 hypothetical protein M8J77_021864 [Diaphorina citri]